jgi:ankyrin repeat protein
MSEVMLKASIHFKRLNISLEDFYAIPSYMISPSKKGKKRYGTRENIKDNEAIDEEGTQQQVTMQRNGQYFFQAIKAGDKSEILKLMNKNFSIMFYRDNFMQSPLHILAKRNLYRYISLFITRGADINAKDEGGRTPLYIAAEQNHLEFVTVLLFEIADPSIKNIKGERPVDVTTNIKIKLILERTKILHVFHKIGKIQTFNESIKNGLSFLYKEEMGINYNHWLKENEEIIKESQKV